MNLNLKKVSRRLVIELATVIALVSFNVNFPKHDSASQAWKFVFKHPTILLHIIVGTILVVESIIFLVRAIRGHDGLWITVSSLGLAFVLVAFASGETYVSTQKGSALTLMGNAAAGALVAFGVGWYWGRRRTRATSTGAQLPSVDSTIDLHAQLN
jgi:hypothetical protein